MNQPHVSLLNKLTWAAADRLIPAFAMCNLTFRCPLACGHCYVTRPTGEAELTLAEYEDLFDQLAEAGTLFLTFSGGDPLLRPDFFEIAQAARARRFAVRLFASGVGITDGVADELAALNLSGVELSLHARTPALQDDFVRRPGAWEEIVAAARRLRARGVFVALKFNAMNFNLHELRAVYELSCELDCTFKHTPFVSAANDGGRAPLAYRLNDAQLKEYYVLCNEVYRAAEGRDIPAPEERKAEGCEEGAAVRRNRVALTCTAGSNTVSFDPYGVAWPCVATPHELGNIRRETFQALWRGQAAERWRAYAEAVIPECAACDYDAYCFRCVADAMTEEGNATAVSREHCRAARAAAVVRGPE